MNHEPLATTPGALTPSWFTAVLNASGDLVDGCVVAADLAPIGTGQMCDSFRVRLRYDSVVDAPRSVIVKIPSSDEATRATATMLRSYETEVRFYQQLAPQVPTRIPRPLVAEIDADDLARFVLVLEDLAPATQGDQLAGCDAATAEMAIDEAVTFHARWWDDPMLTSLDWLTRDPEQRQQFLLMLLPSLWSGFRDRYGSQLESHVHTAGDAVFGRLDGLLRDDGSPQTLTHGDYRLDNLLFAPASAADAGRVAVVDWQTCTVGVGTADIAYFVGAGLAVDERRTHEAGLVGRYHRRLQAAGVDGYDWDACWRDYTKGTWSGLIVAVAASMLVERTDRGDHMFMTMASRHARHALDLDAL